MTEAIDLPDYSFYDHPGPLAIAHRGGDAAGAERENTLVAFESAQHAGINYGETDTVVTRDGVLLAIHGSRTSHQAAKTGQPERRLLQAMTLDEIKGRIKIGGESVPSLEELVTTFPDMKFFIDPKTNEAVRPLARLISMLDLYDRVSVGAFDYRRTKAVVELSEGERRLCSTIGAAGSLALMGNLIDAGLASRYIRQSQATQFAVPHTRVNAPMIERAHAYGKRVILWTPNKGNEIYEAFQNGADGVMSDRTQTVKDMADFHAQPVQ